MYKFYLSYNFQKLSEFHGSFVGISILTKTVVTFRVQNLLKIVITLQITTFLLVTLT